MCDPGTATGPQGPWTRPRHLPRRTSYVRQIIISTGVTKSQSWQQRNYITASFLGQNLAWIWAPCFMLQIWSQSLESLIPTEEVWGSLIRSARGLMTQAHCWHEMRPPAPPLGLCDDDTQSCLRSLGQQVIGGWGDVGATGGRTSLIFTNALSMKARGGADQPLRMTSRRCLMSPACLSCYWRK